MIAGQKRSHALPFAIILPIFAFFFCGCAGYTLGPVNGMRAQEKSIQVNPFKNKTMEPRLTDAVTSQIRKELQRDGTFKLGSQDDADIVVNGVITHYARHEISFAPNDIVTVRDYRVVLTAQVTARERGTGKVLFNGPISGYTLIRVGNDLVSTERQALPLLAQDLAKNVTQMLAEGSW